MIDLDGIFSLSAGNGISSTRDALGMNALIAVALNCLGYIHIHIDASTKSLILTFIINGRAKSMTIFDVTCCCDKRLRWLECDSSKPS